MLAHEKPDPTKPKHSVFCTCKAGDSLKVVDEAWAKRGQGKPCGNNTCYDVNMSRTIGTAGETGVKIVTKPGTNEIITAYPI